MTIAKIKDISYYQSLPYTVLLKKDSEGDFVARIQELPGCIAHGEDEASAISCLRSAQTLWLEDALEAGDIIPEPESDNELPSGKWLQRAPRRLHRDLVDMAAQENVSLNQLVTSLLTEAVTARTCFRSLYARFQSLPVMMHVSADAIRSWGWAEQHHGKLEWDVRLSPIKGGLEPMLCQLQSPRKFWHRCHADWMKAYEERKP